MANYIVQPGDNLNKIAAKYGVDVGAIATANGIKDVNMIRSGSTLSIPDYIDTSKSPQINNNALVPNAKPPTNTANPIALNTSSSSKAPVSTPIVSAPLSGNQTGSSVTQNSGVSSTGGLTQDQIQRLGLSPEDVAKIANPQGLSPDDFTALTTKVRQHLKDSNDLMDQRQILLHSLYDDTPLTKDQIAKLPDDIQHLLKTGSKGDIELQVRVLNDQIAGRANSLSDSIQALTSGYETKIKQAESDKKDAESNIQNYLQMYGSAAVPFLKTKYPEAASTIDELSNLNTLVERKASSSSSLNTGGSGQVLTTGTGEGIVAGVKVDPSIAGDVEDVLSGRNTLYNIRQTMGRTNAAAVYMSNMRNAIREIDPSFDFVASDAGGKFVSSTFYQKALSAITSVEPNIDKAIELSNQVGRIGVAALDSILQKGNVQIGNTKVANFREAQKLIADEIGLALGQGSVSDMKLQLGFDITDPSMSQEVFASNLGVVKEFLANRKKALNDQRYSSPVVAGGTGTSGTSGSPNLSNWLTDYNYEKDIADAKAAIQAGADYNAVKQRLLTKYKEVDL